MVSWVYLWATLCVGCVSNHETLATMCNQLTLKSMTQFTCPAGGERGRGGERPRHEENMAGDCREVCVLQGPRVKNYTLFAYFTVQCV